MDEAQRIVRVFPRRTKASPTDPLAYFGPPGLFKPEAEEVLVSCTFTGDRPLAEILAEDWRRAGYRDVQVGGPAYGDPGGDFEPNMFLGPGRVITSRGCHHHCPFCLAWRREGPIRPTAIREGRILLDNNIFANPHPHVESVFSMLAAQRGGIELSGGIEAALVDDFAIQQLHRVSIRQMFLAYDLPHQDLPVRTALARLTAAGFKMRQLRVYILAGFLPDDTPAKARARCEQVLEWGGLPFLMLYQPDADSPKVYSDDWRKLAREFTRPAAMLRRKTTPPI